MYTHKRFRKVILAVSVLVLSVILTAQSVKALDFFERGKDISSVENSQAPSEFLDVHHISDEGLSFANQANQAPQIADQTFNLDENSPNGAVVGTVVASDPDDGQTLSYTITTGTANFNNGGTANFNNAFAINATTGAITVATSSALDFETTRTFTLTVQVTDDGAPPMSNSAQITITLNDVAEQYSLFLPIIIMIEGPNPRFALLNDVVGFGREVIGGRDGEIYHVTNLNDSGAGSLRAGAESSEILWIVFDVSGTINLASRIDVESNKTIDGRGQNITLQNHGLRISGKDNVVVSHLNIVDGTASEDAIGIRGGSSNVWVNHVTLRNFQDGLLDITGQSNNVTVSWSRFQDHDKVMLIGSSDNEPEDEAITVTMHHNYFVNTVQRHPRLRYGKVHAFNNYLDKWRGYGMASTANGQIFSENNVFEADGLRDRGLLFEISGSGGPQGNTRSQGDFTIGTVNLNERNPSAVFTPDYPYTPETADSALRDKVRNGAGWVDEQP
ncbi:MAG: cadherin domain-containing protein [Chloroflexota bacterium]